MKGHNGGGYLHRPLRNEHEAGYELNSLVYSTEIRQRNIDENIRHK